MSTTKTRQYDKWYASLPDMATRDRIDTRIGRLEGGNPGDARPIGKGASELRFFLGPGYRVYYYQEGDDIILLNGGDKSTQSRDIATALCLLED